MFPTNDLLIKNYKYINPYREKILRNWVIPRFGSCAHCLVVYAIGFSLFWDTETETLVVATHGIIKKTQKTPQKEIQRQKK